MNIEALDLACVYLTNSKSSTLKNYICGLKLWGVWIKRVKVSTGFESSVANIF